MAILIVWPFCFCSLLNILFFFVDVQKSEISETIDEPEKVHKSVSPKKSPKITKSPKVDIEKEKVAEVKEETKPEENDE